VTGIFEIQQLLEPCAGPVMAPVTQACDWCSQLGFAFKPPFTLTEITLWWAGSDERIGTRLICEECNDYERCEECDQYATLRVETAEGDNVCPGCAQQLEQCEDCHQPTRETTYVADEEICQSCLDSNYSYCDQCDAYYASSDWECSTCQDARTSEHIHDYSYRPAPNFLGRGPTYLGWELELSIPPEYIRDCADIAQDMLGYQEEVGYLKEDSSITGFEMVTHPMSYTYAMRHFPWRLLRELRDNGADGDSGEAGLHVHVSRAGFTNPSHIYRWLQFFYRNAEEIQRLARRDSREWARFSDSHRVEFFNFARGSRYGDRYQAVNVLNRHTFEVRVFASSLNPRDVRAALALVAASVEYTRGLTCRDVMAGALNFAQFATWVDARQDVYPDLFAQIVEL
jgi:hypothetical protein